MLTQPDRPAGRKMELQAPPVKRTAEQHGLRVLQPERIKRNEELQDELRAIEPDAILVVAYGRIIPDWMLDLPRYGNVNLHGSLLPKFRGAAPVQWAVATGERETGVTTMKLDAGLDTGDILLERRVPIEPDATSADLFPMLAELGAPLMLETLRGLEAGTLVPQKQNHAAATLAPILTREDGRMMLHARTSQEVYDRWRGFYPWPGAYAEFRNKRFLVHRMLPVSGTRAQPGELQLHGDRLLVGAAQDTALALAEVQVEGKPRMAGHEFARNSQLKAGEHLG